MIESIASRMTRTNLAVFLLLREHMGANNAINLSDIAEMIGCEVMDAFSVIQELRRAGHLILLCDGGYFQAANREEWERFRNVYLRGQAADLVETARAMEQSARGRWGR